MIDQTGEEESFISQHWLALAGGLLVVTALVAAAVLFFGGNESVPVRQPPEFRVVNLVPPPPPPPPPEEIQQPVIEQKPMTEPPLVKQEQKIDQKDTGKTGLDTDNNGPGDLEGSPGGNGLLGGGGGTRWGAYGYKLQQALQKALEANPKTRTLRGTYSVRVWQDENGHVIRVKLAGTTGSLERDQAIEKEALLEVSIDPPPKDMPMPVITRITGRSTS